MSSLTIMLVTLGSLIVVWNLYLTYRAIKLFWQLNPPDLADADCPPILVVFCLRGTDPFLTDVLSRLIAIDYPDYQVRIVIDSPTDPAMRIVQSFLDERGFGNAQSIEVLLHEHKFDTCSCKVSGLLQATEDIPDEVEAVAVLDADTMIPQEWLRQLIQPIVKGKAELTTGNRWYSPRSPSLGTLVRYVWGIYAASQMEWLGLIWGGSFCLSAKYYRDTGFRDRLSRGFTEDIHIAEEFSRKPQSIQSVPVMLIVNREDCTLEGFHRFHVRQLLTVKLQHHKWWKMFCYMLINLLVPLFAILVAITRIDESAWGLNTFLIALSSSTILALSWYFLALFVARRIHNYLDLWTPVRIFYLVLAVPTFIAYLYRALVEVMFTSRHNWRGVEYRFGSNPAVKISHYEPLTDPTRENIYSDSAVVSNHQDQSDVSWQRSGL